MGARAILLYRLPKSMPPGREDVERLVAVLTERLCCVPLADGRGLPSARAGAGGEQREVEAVVTIFKQAQAPDPSAVQHAAHLRDLWLFRLPGDAPDKAYLIIKGTAPGQAGARVTEAEPSIRGFLEKRLDYRQRGHLVIQSQAWGMGDRQSDVTVKLLQVQQQMQALPKVLALELTYHPAPQPRAAQPLLAELAAQLIEAVGPPASTQGGLVLLSPRFEATLPDDWGPLHVAEAYNELLVEGLGAGRAGAA